MTPEYIDSPLGAGLSQGPGPAGLPVERRGDGLGERRAVEQVRLSHLDVPFPGGQSYVQVVAQTRALLADITAEFDGSRVLLVAHSANRWALQHLLDGTPLADAVAAPFDWQPGWSWTVT